MAESTIEYDSGKRERPPLYEGQWSYVCIVSGLIFFFGQLVLAVVYANTTWEEDGGGFSPEDFYLTNAVVWTVGALFFLSLIKCGIEKRRLRREHAVIRES